MKRRFGNYGRLIGVASGLLFCVAAVSGCSSQPREVGNCAVGGAVIGALVGAGGGYGVAYYTRGSHLDQPRENYAAAESSGGAAIGALLGGVAGHYLCDPVLQPPPPPPPPPTPPPPPLPPPPPVKKKERIVLRGVHFDFNKSNIRPGDAAILDEAAETLSSHPNITVYVDGYCDSIGGAAYNLRLSQRRADSVARYLEGHGISSSRLIPRGFGKTNFVAPNDTDEGRAQNRRVELVPLQ